MHFFCEQRNIVRARASRLKEFKIGPKIMENIQQTVPHGSERYK